MSRLGVFRNALFALALMGFNAPEAEAIEIIGGSGASVHLDDGLISTVAVHRGGGHRGGMHRPAGRPAGGHRPPAHRPGRGHRPPVHRPPAHRPPMHRPPMHRPPMHRPPVHRPPVHRPPVVVRPRGVWARPGWYGWPAGGAIAAGAAIGFVTAASAAAWAGAPPQSGLCWYYTDPSRRQGFWDACP
jgi:hypothetical protein